MLKLLKNRKDEKGNITIEATIALTTFLFMFLMIYSLITICRAQARIQVALDGTAKEISQYTYLYNITGLKTSVDGVHSRAGEIEDNVNGFIGDVSKTLDGIQTIKDDVGGSINVGSIEELNNQFDKIKTDLEKTGEDANAVKDTVQQTLAELSDNPQKLMLGLGTVLASETLDLATSRIIAEPVCKTLIQKHLKRSGNDTADAFCKSVGIVQGTYLTKKNNFNGLDFSRSTIFADGSDEIVLVVTYKIRLLQLLPIDAELTITQSAVTKGWLGGDKTATNKDAADKISDIRKKNNDSLWNYASLSERSDLIRSMGVTELKDQGYSAVSGMTHVQAYKEDGDTSTFVMVASSNALYGIDSIDKVDKEAIKNNLKYLQSQIKADTDNVTKVKIKKSSSSGIKTEEVTCKSNKKLVIQVAIPEDEGLKEIYEEQAKALGGDVTFEFIPSYGTAFEKKTESGGKNS